MDRHKDFYLTSFYGRHTGVWFICDNNVFQETWHEEMTKGLFDVESSSDEGIGSDGEGVEVKAPVLADRRKTIKTRRKEAERKTEVP